MYPLCYYNDPMLILQMVQLQLLHHFYMDMLCTLLLCSGSSAASNRRRHGGVHLANGEGCDQNSFDALRDFVSVGFTSDKIGPTGQIRT